MTSPIRFSLLAGLMAVGVLSAVACGSDEGVTPSACPDLGLFNIRAEFVDGGRDAADIASEEGYAEAFQKNCATKPGFAVDENKGTGGGSSTGGGTSTGGASGGGGAAGAP